MWLHFQWKLLIKWVFCAWRRIKKRGEGNECVGRVSIAWQTQVYDKFLICCLSGVYCQQINIMKTPTHRSFSQSTLFSLIYFKGFLHLTLPYHICPRCSGSIFHPEYCGYDIKHKHTLTHSIKCNSIPYSNVPIVCINSTSDLSTK